MNKFMHKMKDKFKKNKNIYPSVSEYAFSSEEIADLNKQNKQKIQDLKQDTLILKIKQEEKEPVTDTLEKLEEKKLEVEEINIEENTLQSDSNPKEIIVQEVMETTEEETNEVLEEEQPTLKNSFINLSKEHQELIMNKWNSIDNNEIDKDIIEGKDLLNHNYTITYADDAARYIHNIRKKYEVVLCYLIGFNNEKKGIYEKTIFSDKMDHEWKYLNNYIKILEKIRNFKKQ